ncbi:transcriptional regulator, MerR family [[Leptolyngbya] sp. PCC 7376]|uniref:MerR family transcriptional regulator n=1 Tax=[Leptolyngbya] sp. PCC 7376 TaxID=111781 RepID=UPI00029F096E|nr:MerR family transcriptional regulator [[Leptolyngbya] sp. PCC 7376]AFY38161.1 transcriptional regulator, MerR family [[Leptolyngbya] sp. PCC 7376]
MFRIGEFSKIAQVPASLLRYYDDIGLFTPIHSDRDTSYRYYSVSQLSQLNRILALKDLGLALDQIKRLVSDEVSPDEIRGMLSLRKAQIEQTLQAEAMRLRAVESRLQQLERGDDFQDDDVVLKSLPAQTFLSLRHQFQDLEQTMAVISQIRAAVSKQVKKQYLERFAAVVHSELYEEQQWDLEFGFYLKEALDLTLTLPNGSTLGVRDLEPVETAVTAVRHDGPENGHLCYSAIGTWAEKHRYKLVGPGREVFLVPPQAGRETEMVVEIQFPVQAPQL